MSVTFRATEGRDDSLSVNVANGNASIVYAILGVEPDDYYVGEIDAGRIREKIVRVGTIDPRELVRPESHHGNIVFAGAPEEQVLSYCIRMEKLLKRCDEIGCGLSWS